VSGCKTVSPFLTTSDGATIGMPNRPKARPYRRCHRFDHEDAVIETDPAFATSNRRQHGAGERDGFGRRRLGGGDEAA
jgi:hypothetical protein